MIELAAACGRTRLLAAAVSGAMLAGLALAPAASAAPTPAPVTDNRVQAAASWLATRLVDSTHKPSPAGDHLEDSFGSSFFFSGTTMDVVFALAAAGVGKDKTAAILTSVATHLNDYAQIADTSGKPGPSDGGIAKVAVAAIVAGADPRAFGGHDLLATMKADECTTVSAPPANDFTVPNCPAVGAGRNVYSSISQSLIMIAQSRAGVTPTAASLHYFESLQCADGGFTTDAVGGASCTSDVDATAYAAFALQALGGHAAALARADGWLAAARNPAGYWIAQSIPNPDSTGLATAALAASGADVSISRSWLLAQQQLTGPTLGVAATRGALKYGGTVSASSTKATADAVLGLAGAGSLATLTASNSQSGLPVLPLSVSVSTPTLAAGGRQQVTVGGFAAGETVQAVLARTGKAVGSVRASATGTAIVTFTVPTSAVTGADRLTLTGTTTGLTASAPFTVTSAVVNNPPSPTPTPSVPAVTSPSPATVAGADELANTGQDARRVWGTALIGTVLLVVGGALTVVSRRRVA
jgi:hypothetical protein